MEKYLEVLGPLLLHFLPSVILIGYFSNLIGCICISKTIVVLSAVLNLAFALSVLGFLIMHISLVAANTTTIEVTSHCLAQCLYFLNINYIFDVGHIFRNVLSKCPSSWSNKLHIRCRCWCICYFVIRLMRRKQPQNGAMTWVERRILSRWVNSEHPKSCCLSNVTFNTWL